MTELQETERLEETDRQVVWTGDPIALHRGGDRYMYSWLSENPRFPGRHTHPLVRSGAEAVVKVTGERDALVADVNARRGPELEQLMVQLDREDEETAAERIARFSNITVHRERKLPAADAAVRAAWENLDATMGAVWPEWLTYLRIHGQEAAERLRETVHGTPTWSLRQVADEIELIDSLMRLEGIKPDRTPTDAAGIAANFDRGQRLASWRQIWNGELRDTEGERYGLGALPDICADLFKTPEPVPEVDSEEVPLAVRVRKQNPGVGAGTYEQNPVTGIIGELPYVP